MENEFITKCKTHESVRHLETRLLTDPLHCFELHSVQSDVRTEAILILIYCNYFRFTSHSQQCKHHLLKELLMSRYVYTARHVASGIRYCTNTVMCVALRHRSAVQVRSVYKSKERDTDRKISDRNVFVFYALFSTNAA